MPTVVSRASGGSKTGGSTLGEILVHWMLCWPDTPNRRDLWRRNPKCRAAGGWPWLAVTADSLSAFPGGPAAIEAGRSGRDAARTPAGGGPVEARLSPGRGRPQPHGAGRRRPDAGSRFWLSRPGPLWRAGKRRSARWRRRSQMACWHQDQSSTPECGGPINGICGNPRGRQDGRAWPGCSRRADHFHADKRQQSSSLPPPGCRGNRRRDG